MTESKQRHRHRARGVGVRGGFTLVELVVALTVLAVALSALIAMFNAALGLGRDARHLSAAAELAETQLNAVVASPDLFLWHRDAPGASGLFAITLGPDDPPAGNTVSSPGVQLASRDAQERMDSFYRQFRWQAWGRLPAPDAQAYEVTVSVHWAARGRSRMVALTSSLPRQVVESAPVPVAGAEGGQAS